MHFERSTFSLLKALSSRFTIGIALSFSLGHGTAAEERALIIASSYEAAAKAPGMSRSEIDEQCAEGSAPPLVLCNAPIDAAHVEGAFKKLGVKDVRKVDKDPTPEVWKQEVAAFLSRLQKNTDVAIVYYVGHGAHSNGRNYFLAADGKTLIAADPIISRVTSNSLASIFFIDACRTNGGDFQQNNKFKVLDVTPVEDLEPQRGPEELSTADNGLAEIAGLPEGDAVVFFSTREGDVARNGIFPDGSPFGNAVVEELERRQSLDASLRAITDDVKKKTAQRPWRQGDLGFYLYLGGQSVYHLPPVP